MSAITRVKYAIIGNSVGGIAAAEAIREIDTTGSIAIISDEPYQVYSRPLISEYLAKPGPIDNLLYRETDFYKNHKIRLLAGEKVVHIDPEKHRVTLESGQRLAYQKLLIATGGTPIVPQMGGVDLKGVFTFNRLDDAKAIDDFLNSRPTDVKAVVIGGGLIGVSVTEALVRRGAEVTIIEMQDRILSLMLDEETSAMEAEALVQAGVRIITGHIAENINSNLPGEVSSVSLDDGRVIYGDLVILAIGVRPRLEAITGSGINVNRGIIVDRHMATSVPDIYACGDVAEGYDFIYGENRLTPIWPNAYLGGRTAGLNMADEEAEYQGGTAMNALKYFGVHIVSAGMVTPPDDKFETISYRQNGNYRKVILKGRKLTGLVFAGDIEKSGIVYNLMKNGVDVSGFKKSLVADEFGLAYLPSKIRQEVLSVSGSLKETGITHVEESEELPIGD